MHITHLKSFQAEFTGIVFNYCYYLSGSNLSIKNIFKKISERKKHDEKGTKEELEAFLQQAFKNDLVLLKKKDYNIIPRTKSRNLYHFTPKS